LSVQEWDNLKRSPADDLTFYHELAILATKHLFCGVFEHGNLGWFGWHYLPSLHIVPKPKARYTFPARTEASLCTWKYF
jgi:hypothetical protein